MLILLSLKHTGIKIMDSSFMGALDNETKKYIHPFDACKLRHYICPGCKEELELCKGTKIRPYFRHKKNSNCSYYGSPGESDIHYSAKMALCKFLEEREVVIESSCLCSKSIKHNIPRKTENDKISVEYRFNYNNKQMIADIAYISNNKIKFIFEVFHTHRTDENDRPNPWFEIKASDILNYIHTTDCKVILNNERETSTNNCGKCVECTKCKKRIPIEIADTNVSTRASMGAICKNCDIELFNRDMYYFDVPFKDKDTAKLMGLRFDWGLKKWYATRRNTSAEELWKLHSVLEKKYKI